MNFIILVSLHVTLAFVTAIFFYLINLNLISKKEASKKSLVWKSVIAATGSALLWLSEVVYLNEYYVGARGFNTTPNITELIPTFAFARGVLLPLVVTIAIIFFALILYRGEYVNANRKLKGILVVLSFLGWVGASALIFLGVLLP